MQQSENCIMMSIPHYTFRRMMHILHSEKCIIRHILHVSHNDYTSSGIMHNGVYTPSCIPVNAAYASHGVVHDAVWSSVCISSYTPVYIMHNGAYTAYGISEVNASTPFGFMHYAVLSSVELFGFYFLCQYA